MASIIDGLFAARSGIQSHGLAIAVLADNISNANTTAFKTSRPEFTDLLAGNLSTTGGGINVGSGSTVNAVTQLFSQGTFEFTGRGLDLGVDGNGFFALENDIGARFYSRAGNLKIDESGNLLNQNNLHILGFPSTGAGGVVPLNVNGVSQQSVETTEVTLTGNLDASATTTSVPAPNPTFAELSSAASYSTSVTIFDTLGATHDVSLFFFNTGIVAGNGTWAVNAYVDGSEITGGASGVPSPIGNGTLSFDPFGQSVGVTEFTVTAPAWADGANAKDVTFAFNPYTQFATSSAVTSIQQDGKGGGSVVSFNVEKDGTLFAQLSNGQTSAIGKVALATFANPEGLRRQGDSLYAVGTSSGEPILGIPSSGQFGAIQSGALETSNTDLASDFIKLISLQRGFQGSSRIVTNINDLLNALIQLA